MTIVNSSISSNQLLINLSIVFAKPTGISNYAQCLFPYLEFLEPTLLTAHHYPSFNCYSIRGDLNPARGTKGHLLRLAWTQLKLPQIYRKLRSRLLFSPVPEAPLYSDCNFIVTAHDFIPLRFYKQFSRLTAYHRYYIPAVLRQAQHIICNSESTAEDVTNFFQISARKITAIPLAYDRNHFSFLDLPTANYFLYLGRPDPYKNIWRSLTAFSRLPDCQDYEFWIAGPSDYRYTPELKRLVMGLGIEQQVRFLDYVPYEELPRMINRAIALVFPSLWEGFGLPVLEAMACGTPVITSNVSALPEVAGDAAILVDPYNVNEIADAMRMVAADSQLHSELRQKGLARAKLFSWEKTGRATADLLSQYL